MWISWFVFGFVMIATNRWFKEFWMVSQYIHTISGLIITALTLYYALTIRKISQDVDDNQIYKGITVHRNGGPILMIAVSFISFTGFISFGINFVRWSSFLIKFTKIIHRLASYSALILGSILLTTGIIVYFNFYL